MSAQPLAARRPVAPLAGTVRVPGDKSISHRAVMLGALAIGETVIDGLLEGEDVLATAAAMAAMGADIQRGDDGIWRIHGVGVGGLAEPARVLDMGNSGTSTRLIAGLLASHDITSFITGDASLVRRPMTRIVDPLSQMGARFVTRSGGRPPMAITGAAEPIAITYETPVASAQVKSAVLLAGLSAPGITTVIERRPTRDHSETMLRAFGAKLTVEPAEGGGNAIGLVGEAELTATPVTVPADPSSAAFPICAALLVEGSDATLRQVAMNPTRSGLIDTLVEMGATIERQNQAEIAGEPVADLRVRGTGPLTGVDVPPDRAASMIDEYPVLAMVAALARGTTRMTGIGELRVKESDRLAVVAEGLHRCGVTVRTGPDWMEVDGAAGQPVGGAKVATHLDHRIAMSFLVLGLATADPVAIDDARPIATSFPGFVDLLLGLSPGDRFIDAPGAPG